MRGKRQTRYTLHTRYTAWLLFLATLAWSCPPTALAGGQFFRRGDANVDGQVALSDAFRILRALFQGAPLKCLDAADVDDDGEVTYGDVFRLITALFYHQTPPPEPFLNAGTDPTSDSIGCRQGLFATPEDLRPEGEGAGAGGLAGLDELLGEDGASGCEDPGGGADIDFLHFRGELLVTPGETSVRVPVYMVSAGDVEGVTLSLYAPPDLLRLDAIDFSASYLNRSGLVPEWTHNYTGQQDDGFLVGTMAMSIGADIQTMPPARDDVLAHVTLSVAPDAPVGSHARILFRTTPGQGGFLPIPNEISRLGNAQARFVCGLSIDVVDGRDVFIRGDANRDRRVNIVDVITVLRALFFSGDGTNPGTLLPCRDAADVDDSGSVEVTDAISLANYLFGRGAAPVLPFPNAGRDWSDDDPLGCEP